MNKIAHSTEVPSRKAVLGHFSKLPNEIQKHFQHFRQMISSNLPLEVSLAYLFYMVEIAHRDTLYCSSVRLHHADATIARNVVQHQHLTRQRFNELFENALGKPLAESTQNKLKGAEKIRDKAIHGSEPTEAQMRKAIANLLYYANQYNAFVKSVAGFPPFGDLRGFHGKGKRL